jgi:hypothetical protein
MNLNPPKHDITPDQIIPQVISSKIGASYADGGCVYKALEWIYARQGNDGVSSGKNIHAVPLEFKEVFGLKLRRSSILEKSKNIVDFSFENEKKLRNSRSSILSSEIDQIKLERITFNELTESSEFNTKVGHSNSTNENQQFNQNDPDTESTLNPIPNESDITNLVKIKVVNDNKTNNKYLKMSNTSVGSIGNGGINVQEFEAKTEDQIENIQESSQNFNNSSIAINKPKDVYIPRYDISRINPPKFEKEKACIKIQRQFRAYFLRLEVKRYLKFKKILGPLININ